MSKHKSFLKTRSGYIKWNRATLALSMTYDFLLIIGAIISLVFTPEVQQLYFQLSWNAILVLIKIGLLIYSKNLNKEIDYSTLLLIFLIISLANFTASSFGIYALEKMFGSHQKISLIWAITTTVPLIIHISAWTKIKDVGLTKNEYEWVKAKQYQSRIESFGSIILTVANILWAINTYTDHPSITAIEYIFIILTASVSIYFFVLIIVFIVKKVNFIKIKRNK